jgi:hypothetical protein
MQCQADRDQRMLFHVRCRESVMLLK